MSDTTGVIHVAFCHHLVFVTYFLTNVGAKFGAKRAKIASAVSNSVYKWKKTNDAIMTTSHMTCVKFIVTVTFAIYMLTYASATIELRNC